MDLILIAVMVAVVCFLTWFAWRVGEEITLMRYRDRP
jgi:hypothetical protein